MTQDQLMQAKEVIHQTLLGLRPQLVRAYGAVDHTAKADKTIVTVLDGMVEDELHAALEKFDSGIGFVGEEAGERLAGDTYWLVDPIDGTEHFVRGLPQPITMVALMDQNRPVFGVLYDFIEDKFYWAAEGVGAWRNDERIHVSKRSTERAMVATEIDERVSAYKQKEPHLTLLNENIWPTDLGTSGHCQRLVAEGKIEALLYYSTYVHPHDLAAGAVIVREAGGIVRNVGAQDDELDLANKELVYASPQMYEKLQSLQLV